MKKIFFTFFFLVIYFGEIYTQKSYYFIKTPELLEAIDLYEKEKYIIAQQKFEAIKEQYNNNQGLEHMLAEYYSFLCASKLFNRDVKYRGEKFIGLYPESPFINQVYFILGNQEYLNKNYKNALAYFQYVEKIQLTEDEAAELNFKRGYSWLMIDSVEKARLSFYEIKDIDTRYTSAAVYYYAHIAYLQKNYETALQHFKRLQNEEDFSSIVPYYISQCYYFLDKYDDLIAYATTKIDSVVPTREAEMNFLIGNAYYRKNMFEKALFYYERYLEKERNIEKLNYYQPAYVYYYLGKYDKAIPLFEKVAVDHSLLGQSASYHLGYCYIKSNMKEKALLAFSSAAKDTFNKEIQEDAAFHYAVLTYELSNSPFNNSIKALSDYIATYPNSRRTEEAYNYLIAACLNTRNYQEALNYLTKVKNKDNRIRKAYQRAAFFRGLELYNNLDFTGAFKAFELSLKYSSSDAIIAARTYYWQAEIYYRNKEIEDALDNYLIFYNATAAKHTEEYKMINYNLGYCYFNKKNYSVAARYFQKFIDQKSENNKLISDTYNRLGDCAFMVTKYREAIQHYTKSIDIGAADKDYATFQKAFSLGLLGEHNKKIELLENLIKTSPTSNYNDDALYEIGQSKLAIQRPNEAVQYYKRIIKNHPLSSYVKKAWLQMGLIDYNANRFDSAIVKYRKVITDYPNSPEARSALNGIKNIYMELNDLDTFFKLSESLGSIANLNKAEQDSLMYYTAEKLYTSSQWQKAIENFHKYLQKFPNGNFIVAANYYIADCYLRTGQFAAALDYFNKVIKFPRNNFTEQALVAAAKLNIDKKDYYAALSNVEFLDTIAEIPENIIFAREGIIQANFFLSRYIESINAAQRLLNFMNLTDESERFARYYLAKSYLALNDEPKALDQLRKIAKDVKNKEGAEAKYLIATIYYRQNQADKAMKEIFNFVDLNSPHVYWIAKAYILLAKIYYDKGNAFQAIKTLESIIENYDNKTDGIIKEASELKKQFEK